LGNGRGESDERALEGVGGGSTRGVGPAAEGHLALARWTTRVAEGNPWCISHAGDHVGLAQELDSPTRQVVMGISLNK
jgi:hypothetical protein